MPKLLVLLMVLNIITGCGPATEPVGSRPSQGEMMGNWTLVNSPKLCGSLPVSVPTKGSSSITLTSNQVVKLTNVLVQTLTDFSKAPSGVATTLKTGDAAWEIAESQGRWSIEINVGSQVIPFTILQKGDADFELSYRPDPESDAFIFARGAKAQGR